MRLRGREMKAVGFRMPESDLIQRHKRLFGSVSEIENGTLQLLIKRCSGKKPGGTKQTERAENRPVFGFYPFTYRLKFRQTADPLKHLF